MKFIICAQLFEELESISSRLEITQKLADFFNMLTAHELEIMCNLLVGQLHPIYVGTQFAIADKMMIRAIARHTGHSDATIQQDLAKVGDLGAVLASYHWQPDGELSITALYDQLCRLEQTRGEGSQDQKIELLVQLFKQLHPDEAKFIVRIILGKLRLGFSDMTIIDALSWMLVGNKSLRTRIEDAYNRCANLGHIAQIIHARGIDALNTIDITVGTPILPAAAERLPSAAEVIEKLGPCAAQPKLDGFRLQIHVDRTQQPHLIHFYSRNLQDMSHMFPDLLHVFDTINVKTLICEGEAISYDPHTGAFLPFQETAKRKRKHDIAETAHEIPLKLFLFDLLYYNGDSFLEKTHTERRATLIKIMRSAQSDIVQIIDEKKVSTAAELETYFNAMIEMGLEGLVVKRPDTPYQPGKRNFNWIKLKRHAEGHLEDTIDCVILGYYAGQGKRADFGIGALLVGVYNKQEDLFETIARIGTGPSDAEWRDIKKKCDAYAVTHKPTSVICTKELTPDVWVAPEIVCTIFADEITISPMHSAGKTASSPGYALRFPRFMGYRPDKSAVEATTTHEIIALYQDQYHARSK